MKSTITFCSAALLRLALGQSTAGSGTTFWQASSPSSTSVPSTWTPSTPAPAGQALCGQGFTYCGYILRDHQNFKEEDVVKAYCAASKGNCANGKTKTDPIQGLYVCLPANANPKEEDMSPNPHFDSSSSSGKSISGISRFFGILSSRTHMGQAHDAHEQHNGMQARQVPASNATNAGNDGGSCNTLATAGNRIELLCACSGNCLNPVSDHIGRCDASC
ncbi:hypothetical protein B0T20DRAFT_110 [Sordaria brevicollis]|uniref:Uncharacterized protein n=1 Tax=Sordaria brevicollis TaxID=83679 RepID=A0AAE0PMG0_SORBR|nr:hypothetical protein B0T20DRAFT_110 [Sordaria brevicollis]